MGIVLHITPADWGLPSVNPSCLAAVLFLQLSIPGKFSVSECTNPDASPTGQLPYLTHDHHVAVNFSSIVKYVSSLEGRKAGEYPNANIDQGLSKFQLSQKTAWSTHAETHLGDLLYYMLYSVSSNWVNMTYQTLSSQFPRPQRYYVPFRIRELYRPRLEAAGLWSIPDVEKEPKKPFKPISPEVEKVENTSVFLQAFEKEKVTEKAKPILDLYSRLLKKDYFFERDRPSALDAIVAAHILLLLEPPYPDPVVKQLLLDSYPSLVTHARLIFSQTLAASAPAMSKVPAPISTWRDVLPSMPWSRTSRTRSEDEIRFDKLRWSFFGLVVGSMVAYLSVVGRNVKIRIVRAEDVAEEEEDEELEEGDGELEDS
ncbi:hypothetical protein JOM56_003407 [Amanita muscaria]